jgi:hypothetical protein
LHQSTQQQQQSLRMSKNVRGQKYDEGIGNEHTVAPDKPLFDDVGVVVVFVTDVYAAMAVAPAVVSVKHNAEQPTNNELELINTISINQ